MPLYHYTCQKCAHDFEALLFDGESAECPQCHGTQLDRHWGVPARPTAQAASLPTACKPSLPPCGPGCCRLPTKG
jgi:putative FmdB family regulatory protein